MKSLSRKAGSALVGDPWPGRESERPMSYHDEEDEPEEREPRTLLDMYIEPEARCTVCAVKNSIECPMTWVCSECGGPTHAECGADTEPSGGWDRDYEVNCSNLVCATGSLYLAGEVLRWAAAHGYEAAAGSIESVDQ